MQNTNNIVPQGQQQVAQTNAATNNAIVAAEVAKVQAMCVMAYQNPRNMLNVENKINIYSNNKSKKIFNYAWKYRSIKKRNCSN